MITEDAPVRVCMTCAYCGWAVVHAGPAGEVAAFLRALALAHVHELHPARVPAGDVDVLVMRDLGFS